MSKILALSLGALLVLSTGAARATSDATNPLGTRIKVECCSHLQMLAEEKVNSQPVGEPTGLRVAGPQVRALSVVHKRGSTGPTHPPKPVNSKK